MQSYADGNANVSYSNSDIHAYTDSIGAFSNSDSYVDRHIHANGYGDIHGNSSAAVRNADGYGNCDSPAAAYAHTETGSDVDTAPVHYTDALAASLIDYSDGNS